MRVRMSIAGVVLAGIAGTGHAVQVCELNGQSVNPANGNTTAGKTGLMRCREGEGGPVVREQELRDGKFMGIVRYYKDGVLEREHSVNERGNQEGLAREFAATKGDKNAVLREQTYRNGSTVGIARTWYPSGQLKRVGFYDDAGREEAVAEFTAQGKLAELRCAPRARLAPHANDAEWCGHAGAPRPVALYASSGDLAENVTYERGALRARDTFYRNGKLRQQMVTDGSIGIERSFGEDGVKRREVEWTRTAADGDRRPRGTTTRDSEYHSSGKLVRERRWTPDSGQLLSESGWYLNGQQRERIERIAVADGVVMRETRYFDNGKPSFEGDFLLAGRNPRQATGIHKRYDDLGRLREETYHDVRGRVTRERELDETGRVVRDEELYEDGSRKSTGR